MCFKLQKSTIKKQTCNTVLRHPNPNQNALRKLGTASARVENKSSLHNARRHTSTMQQIGNAADCLRGCRVPHLNTAHRKISRTLLSTKLVQACGVVAGSVKCCLAVWRQSVSCPGVDVRVLRLGKNTFLTMLVAGEHNVAVQPVLRAVA